MAGAKRDYYEVLGVPKDADEAAIKRAFKRLAIKYHPDHNKDPDAGDKFREINEAYQVLSDPDKRRAYDQFGFEGLNAAGGGAGGAGPFGGGADFGDIFGDIFGSQFNDIFGGGSRGGAQSRREAMNRGRDMRIHVELTLEEAVKGVKRQVKVRIMDVCPTCHGTGSRSGKLQTCPHCRGTGQIVRNNGFLTMAQTCPYCHGSGQVAADPCPDCRGSGRVQQTKTLSVTIPAGVDDGDRIRLSQQGEAGINGAPSGDLYVDIVVKPHEIFERHGNDLYCELPISFTTAALGGQVEVPTLDGRVSVTIRPETQTGTTMRLTGRGVKSYNSSVPGNLYCKVLVETPVNLTEEQKDLLRRFEASLNGESLSPEKQAKVRSSHKPKSEGFLEGVKRFFDNLSK